MSRNNDYEYYMAALSEEDDIDQIPAEALPTDDDCGCGCGGTCGGHGGMNWKGIATWGLLALAVIGAVAILRKIVA